jgi:hypothetical protein
MSPTNFTPVAMIVSPSTATSRGNKYVGSGEGIFAVSSKTNGAASETEAVNAAHADTQTKPIVRWSIAVPSILATTRVDALPGLSFPTRPND